MNKVSIVISVIALASAASVFAAEREEKAPSAVQAAVEEPQEKSKNNWEKTKDKLSETTGNVADATKEAYQDVKSFIFEKEKKDLHVATVKINPLTTAKQLIGAPIHNAKERIGTVSDVILDRDGKATMIIVADGELFGLGKLAAFKYSRNIEPNADGDVIMHVTEEDIDQAAPFSYAAGSSDKKVRVMPSNGYSLAKLLDGKLIDPEGKTLAKVDDISMERGETVYLILGFDKILGLGGEQVAMRYTPDHIVTHQEKNENSYDFRLSAVDQVKFENYKKSKKN